MIKLVTETSFKDKEGIYRKFNIQILESVNIPYNMIVINLDGYDALSCGLKYSSFADNKELFFQHIDTMFGLKDIDNLKIILLEKNIAYRRSNDTKSPFYNVFVRMVDGDFDKEYKRFLEN